MEHYTKDSGRCVAGGGVASEERALLNRAYAYGIRYRGRLALLLGLTGLSMAVALVQPSFLGTALDCIIEEDLLRTYVFLGAMLAATVAQGVVSLAETYLTARLATQLSWQVKGDLYGRLVSLACDVQEHTSQGELLSRIEGDSGAVGNLLLRRLMLVPEAVRALAVLTLLLRMSWMLTAAQMLILPAMLIGSELFGAALRRRGSLNRGLMDRYMSYVQETAAGYREIKALQLERDRVDRFAGLAGQALRSSIGLTLLDAYAGLTNMLAGGLGTVAVVGFAAWQIVSGRLTVGQLVAFTAYAAQLAASLEALAGFRRSRQECLVSITRVFELLDRPQERATAPPPALPADLRGRLTLDSVSFGYEGYPPVLRGVSCTFEPGRLTGIAGLSGSGKTTLFNLLLRFYSPTGGSIQLDGRDIREYSIGELRRAISIVSQDPFLFEASIRENLLYGNPTASPRDLERACELAGILGFIKSLPQDLDTTLAGQGGGISGGQRQRLALARAILRDSPVLLCDEITAALDGEAASVIQRTLLALARDRTVAVIAHRPSTIENANLIVVLHDGQVAGLGTHGELIRSNPVYRRLLQPVATPGAARLL